MADDSEEESREDVTDTDSINIFKNLHPFDESDAEVLDLDIADEVLKQECLERPCEVSAFRFNVSFCMWKRGVKQYKAAGRKVNTKKLMKLIEETGYDEYLAFYKPREEWRRRQRMYSRRSRQQRYLLRNMPMVEIKVEPGTEENKNEKEIVSKEVEADTSFDLNTEHSDKEDEDELFINQYHKRSDEEPPARIVTSTHISIPSQFNTDEFFSGMIYGNEFAKNTTSTQNFASQLG